MDSYVGLDVSLRSVAFCVIDANGEHICERSAPYEIDDIVAYLRDFPTGQCRIGFESGAMSQHLYFWAVGCRFRCRMHGVTVP